MISTNKWDTQIAAKEIIISQQSGSFPLVQTGGTFQNVGVGLTLTIQKTGTYKIICRTHADISYTTNNQQSAVLRLACNGVGIAGTVTQPYKNTAAIAGAFVFPVSIESPIQAFNAGDVITLQGYKTNTDALAVYSTSVYQGFIQAEMTTAWVPVLSDTWFTYIPTITADTVNPTKGTINTDLASYRLCDGRVLEIYYNYYQTAGGTTGTGYYEWSLPPGFSINSAICPYGTHAYLGTVGQGLAYSSATPEVQVLATAYSATTWRMLRNNSTLAWVGSTQYHLNYVTLMYAIHLRIPVL